MTVSAIKRLAELRQEIVVAEDRFLAKYNDLNQVRQYAIKCTDEAFTSTKLYRRQCRPEYVNRATADEATGWLFRHYVPPADLIVASKKGRVPQEHARSRQRGVRNCASSPSSTTTSRNAMTNCSGARSAQARGMNSPS